MVHVLLLGDRQPVVGEECMHECTRHAGPRGAVSNDGRKVAARLTKRCGRETCELWSRFSDSPRQEGVRWIQPRRRGLPTSCHQFLDSQVDGRFQECEEGLLAHDLRRSAVDPIEATTQ